jgi:rRNA maturation endonuclease Nob1
MASWREKLNQAAQNTISKSKEVAEIAKLNVEIGSSNQSMKNIYTEVGKYVLENGLLSEDESVAEWAAKAADIKAEIEASTERIKALKNVNTCPGCGAEVPKTSKFCDKCGTPIVVTSTEPVKEDEEIIDADFSEASQEAEAAQAQEAGSEAAAAKAGCCCAEAQETPGED